jgi:hypothetical protein
MTGGVKKRCSVLELKIDQILIEVEGDDWEEEQIRREISRLLNLAFERIAGENLLPGAEDQSIETLRLPPVDWDAETDKTARLAALVMAALEENLAY